ASTWMVPSHCPDGWKRPPQRSRPARRAKCGKSCLLRGVLAIGRAGEEHRRGCYTFQLIHVDCDLPNPLKWSPVRPHRTVLRKVRRVERPSSQATFLREELRGE